MAYAYLRDLDGEPSYLTYLLVFFDLVRIAYLTLSYVACAALAVALGRAGSLPPRRTRVIAVTGATLAALVCAGAVAAGLDGPAGAAGAWTAFVLTIPFMATLLPHLLGAALLKPVVSASRRSPRRPAPVTPLPSPPGP